MSDYDDDDVTELTFVDPQRLDGVRTPATGSTFIVLKAAGGRGRIPEKARAAFAANASRVKQGRPPRKGKVKGVRRGPDGTLMVAGPDRAAQQRAKAERRSQRRASKGVRVAMAKASEAMRYSSEIPATNVSGESASILTCVTGESAALCSARTVNGAPCRRPAVNGGRCHLHR